MQLHVSVEKANTHTHTRKDTSQDAEVPTQAQRRKITQEMAPLMDTKERYLGERDDTDWQALSLRVPLIPTIITINITIASRWTDLNAFAAHTQPARWNTARRKKDTSSVNVQVTDYVCVCVCVCVHLSKKKKKKQGERPSHLHYKRISRKSADVFA